MTALAARDVADVQDAVLAGRVLPVGGATKPALSGSVDGLARLDVSGLRGIVDYDPGELTLTARAGTPVADVSCALAEHGQYLPFDPPLSAAGATVGGVVASGAAGPGAFRHGGVRDFVIGVRLVDGRGRLVAGGGKVVKNAAGFDLPKLMVGSIGRLGVIVEASFKVFPAPQATLTVVADVDPADWRQAVAVLRAAQRGPVELDALDVAGGQVMLRLAGAARSLPGRAERLIAGLPGPAAVLDDDADTWQRASELTWAAPDRSLVRVPTTVHTMPKVAAAGVEAGGVVRVSLGGNITWVALPGSELLAAFGETLRGLGARGVALSGSDPRAALLGGATGGAFATRVRAALDPDGRFLEL